MEKINIGIVGCGFVGSAVAQGFSNHNVLIYDIDEKRRTNSFKTTVNSDFVFCCLPTPMKKAEGGEANLDIIYDFFTFATLNENTINKKRIFIIKSTVPVGTTKYISSKHNISRIVHNPEFLTAKNAINDFLNPKRIVIGGQDINSVYKVNTLYHNRFPNVPIYLMGSDESEMVKYVSNCFLAVKVTFFNEMYELCHACGINWNQVIDGVMSDDRIGKSHYQVPGPDGDKGFGSVCFPKDLNAMIKTIQDEGTHCGLLEKAWEENKFYRKNWDWVNNKSAVNND